ncbi:MAG: hypothetical protein KAH23_08430 [Kiritimatiellae bacterium]|nr:hypothetical protein [Kiritimatiellia bacterium]
MKNGAIVIYPTSLALRQYQQNEAEKHGFCDSRGHFSTSQFLGGCAEAAVRMVVLGIEKDEKIAVAEVDGSVLSNDVSRRVIESARGMGTGRREG